MGKIIFAISGKGGTGKTSAAAGITACLGILGHKTALLDADAGLRNADIVLGLSDKAVMHLGDVLSGRVTLSDALTPVPDIPNLSVLAAPGGDFEIKSEDFKKLLEELSASFEFVWIDGPAGMTERIRMIAALSDEAVVVATPDIVSMRDAARIAEMLDDIGGKPSKLIVNRVRPSLITAKGALYIDDLMDGTGLPLLGVVPEDERVIAAGNRGVPLVALAQDGAALAFRNIALRLLGERVPLGEIKVTSKAKRAFWAKLNRVEE